MKRLLVLALVGCGLFFTAAGQATPPKQEGPPNFPVANLEKTKQVDLSGILEWVQGGPDPVWACGRFTGYRILANGTSYELTGIWQQELLCCWASASVSKGVLNVTHCGRGQEEQWQEIRFP